MDVHKLKIFLAVAEELHFGRAAERLYLAQPPVSRAVRQLESELGVELFIRNTRNVNLTAAGEMLRRYAEDIVDLAARARHDVIAADKGELGRLSIAYAGASTHVLVGTLARELKRSHSGIEVQLESQLFAQPALSRVIQGEVDISLGRWDLVPDSVESKVVLEEQLVLAVPASHRLAGRLAVSLAQFAKEPFIALPPHEGSVLNDRLRVLSFEAGFEANIIQRAPDSWTAMALVGAEVGVSLTVSSVAANISDAHVKFLDITDEYVPIQLRMAWQPKSDNPALKSVLQVADSVWQE